MQSTLHERHLYNDGLRGQNIDNMRTSPASAIMPTWHFTRSNTRMRLLTELAAEHGLAAERALTGTGVSTNQWAATPGGVVTAVQELRLIDNIVEHLAT